MHQLLHIGRSRCRTATHTTRDDVYFIDKERGAADRKQKKVQVHGLGAQQGTTHALAKGSDLLPRYNPSRRLLGF